MKLVATCIGEKKEINWKGKIVTTGIFKYPVDFPIFLDLENVQGDAICNRKHHGGIYQAVYGYSLKHYQYWQEIYPDLEWQMGAFGENLTLDDLDETKIHVGDTFRVGEAIIEATKPRVPCLKLGVRFGNIKIVKQFWNTTMSGVYFKVLQTGFVNTGDTLHKLNHFPKNPTIAEVYQAKKVENLNK